MNFSLPVAFRYLKLCLATLFGLGFLPVAPGTWGSLGALALFFLFEHFFAHFVLIILFVLFLFISFPLSAFGAQYLDDPDPGAVVIDELIGLWFVLLPILLIFDGLSLIDYTAGFALFRFFDVLKPPPIKQTQRLPGAFGIVADDLAAGLISAILIAAVKYHL